MHQPSERIFSRSVLRSPTRQPTSTTSILFPAATERNSEKKKVPFAGDAENFESYDTVLIGFPIWYGGAPGVVNDFCQAHDFTGKKVAAFATSGGSGIGKTAVKLQPYVKGASVVDAKLFQSADPGPLKAWAQSL